MSSTLTRLSSFDLFVVKKPWARFKMGSGDLTLSSISQILLNYFAYCFLSGEDDDRDFRNLNRLEKLLSTHLQRH